MDGRRGKGARTLTGQRGAKNSERRPPTDRFAKPRIALIRRVMGMARRTPAVRLVTDTSLCCRTLCTDTSCVPAVPTEVLSRLRNSALRLPLALCVLAVCCCLLLPARCTRRPLLSSRPHVAERTAGAAAQWRPLLPPPPPPLCASIGSPTHAVQVSSPPVQCPAVRSCSSTPPALGSNPVRTLRSHRAVRMRGA